jgi:hypothetical protein
LALTAHVLADARRLSAGAGCSGHITKPIQKAQLLAALSEYSADIQAGPISAEAEPWLKAIIPGYLDKRRGDLATLFSALERRDFPLIRTFGHQLAGTGASYGFPLLTEIGAALEQAAIAGDPAVMRTEAERLKACLEGIAAR